MKNDKRTERRNLCRQEGEVLEVKCRECFKKEKVTSFSSCSSDKSGKMRTVK